MKGIEKQCLLDNRQSLERKVFCRGVVDKLVESAALNLTDKHYILQEEDPVQQNARLIDRLLQKGTPVHFQQFMIALKAMGHEREYQLLHDSVQRYRREAAAPAPKSFHRQGPPDTPQDASTEAILDAVNVLLDKTEQTRTEVSHIRSTQREDHEQLSEITSQITSMRREMDAFFQRIRTLEEEVSDLKQRIDHLEKKLEERQLSERTPKDVQKLKKVLDNLITRAARLEQDQAVFQDAADKDRKQGKQMVRDLKGRLDSVRQKLDTVYQGLEGRLDRVDDRMVRVEGRLEQQQTETSQMSDRLTELERQMSVLNPLGNGAPRTPLPAIRRTTKGPKHNIS